MKTAIKPIMYNNVVFLFKIDQIIKTIIIILFSYISSFQNGLTDLPIIYGCHFMTIIIIVLKMRFINIYFDDFDVMPRSLTLATPI